MNSNNEKEHLLVTIGKAVFEKPQEKSVHFVDDPLANSFINDLTNNPHAYVLACTMDRQIKAERAWMIPSRMRDIVGDFSIDHLAAISLPEYQRIFSENSLHRFNDIMAGVFYDAVQRIQKDYSGDASKLWAGNPGSAAVVYRFLQFHGVGIKIATMATNILAREFRVPFSDYYSIDISPDVHVLRVMRRSGLVEKDADIDSIVFKARELCPEFPGIIDISCWEIGRTWCRPHNPNCIDCCIQTDCMKILEN